MVVRRLAIRPGLSFGLQDRSKLMTYPLCYLSAAEALQRFADGSLSPAELMRAVIERAEEVEPVVNALCLTDFDAALRKAEQAEKRYQDGTARPLEGLPVAIKDESDIAGCPNTNGSLLLKDNVATKTDPVPQRLLDAGAIAHSRTTTPEFSMAFFCWSRLWGITRNPWNPAISPGGSSGGSGAALACGTTTLATGSDIGGSIRVPASLNGIVGYKPPYGRVPQTSPWNLDTYCHEGSMARSVRDCILMQNVIAGPHPEDIATLKPKLELPLAYDDIKGMRLAVSPNLGFFDVADDVVAVLSSATQQLSELGAVVETIELAWDRRCQHAAVTHFNYLSGQIFKRDYGDLATRDLLTPYIRKFIEHCDSTTADDIIAAREYSSEMYAELARVFRRYDALLCPTVATTTIAADYGMTETSEPDGSIDSQLDLYMTYPFNTLSRCPVLAVPCGAGRNGVPIGLQVVAPPYDDPTVFRVGVALEAAFPPLHSSGTLPNPVSWTQRAG